MRPRPGKMSLVAYIIELRQYQSPKFHFNYSF